MIYATALTIAAVISFLCWRMALLHDQLADLNQLVADMLLAPDREEQERLAKEHLDKRRKR